MSTLIALKTISEAHTGMGLGKPKHPLISVVPHRDILRLPSPDIRTRVDLYHISFKDGPAGALGYGRNSYDFEEGTLIFSSPGQVMSVKQEAHEIPDPGDGWMLLFHPDLIRKSPLGKTIDHYSFFSYDAHEALHISDNEKSMIADLTKKIQQEYSQNIDKHSQKLIISTLELMLDYCQRFYDRQFYTRTNLNQDILEKFKSLLTGYYESERALTTGLPSVSYCGAELNMSPKYLSDLLKKETGKSTQDHIHDFVMDRAKTELLSTTESISQIAYGLGFEYPQHFSKMFKRKTGISPMQYRRAN